MALYTIYLLVSIAVVFVIAMSIVKNVHFRRTGVLIFDKKYKPGTSEYKRLEKLFDKRNLITNIALLFIFIANLVFAVSIAHSSYHDYALIIFIFASLFVIGIFVSPHSAEENKASS
jgi:hypothetical protein